MNPQLSSLSESITSLLKGIERRLQELEERRQRLLDEISSLRPGSGTLEYKWVLNKVGRKYYYWYLRVRKGSSLRSIYLGKRVPDKIFLQIEDRKRLRELQRELDSISEEIMKLQKKLYKAVRDLA